MNNRTFGVGSVGRRIGVTVAGVGLASSLSVSRAAAQITSQGIFQPAIVQGESDFSVQASGAAGWDSDSASTTVGGTTVVPGGAGNGGRMDGQVGVNYAKPGRHVSFGASGGSAFRGYQGFSSHLVWSHNGSAALAWQPAQHMSLQTMGSASYSPFQQFAVFPTAGQPELGQIAPPSLNYGTSSQDVVNYQSQTNVTYDLGSRSSLSGGYDFAYADYDGTAFDLQRFMVNGRYRRGMTRNLALKAGYSFNHANYQAVIPVGSANLWRAHNIDAGVDYARSLSFSRHTTLSFGTGTVILNDGVQSYFRVVGDAMLHHQLNRTWDLTGGYMRRVNFVNGFTEPFFADSFSVDASGLWGPQINVVLSAGYSRGDVGLGAGARSYAAYHGTVRAQRPITRYLGLFGEYLYYHHNFARPIAVPLGTPDHLSRNGVRVGLTAMLPITGGGRTRASR